VDLKPFKMEEGKPGSRRERIRTMLLRREQVSLTNSFRRRRLARLEKLKFLPLDMTKRVTTSWALGGTRFTNAGTYTLLNGLATGFTAVTRIGRKVTITRIEYNAMLEDGGGGANAAYARAIIFLDKQANGATPAVATFSALLLEAPNQPAVSAMNPDQAQRFEVLMDYKTVVANAAIEGALIPYDYSCEHNVVFNAGTAGTIADIQTGALYLYCVTQNNPALDTASVTVHFIDA